MIDKTQYIGITEAGDPAFNLDIFDRLYQGNIIISKNLTNKLIEKLLEHKDTCVLHITATGMGGSKIEPFVPTIEKTRKQLWCLIEGGFPIEQIVLRIDPIVPTNKGLLTAKNVLTLFSDLGIKRVRISFLDMYKHVKDRFDEENIKHPYEGFHASLVDRKNAFDEIVFLANELGYGVVETCGEPDFPSTPCLSQKDIDILHLTDVITLVGNKEQRHTCGCPANKKELIKGKPHQCDHKCLYCFWK